MENPRGLFWIKGNPGTGKSVLIKFAVKKMHERKPGELILSFFIHGQGTDLQKTPLGIFRALLNSILQDFPEYLAQLTAKYEDREKRFGGYMADRWKWSNQELQEFLFDVLTEGTKYLPVIIFVDALDECGEGPAKSLLAYFKDLAKQVERKEAPVKICLSSRHYPILGHPSDICGGAEWHGYPVVYSRATKGHSTKSEAPADRKGDLVESSRRISVGIPSY